MSREDWGSHENTQRTNSPRHRGKPGGFWIRPFLVTLAECGNIAHSARIAGITRDTVESRKKRDPRFAQHMKEALAISFAELEKEARRRAMKGYEEPVYGNKPGKGHTKVGIIRKYSDTLLIFLMKGANPKKYRDNYKVSIEGQVDHTHTHTTMKHILSDPQAVEAATQLAKRLRGIQQQTPSQN